MAAPGWTAPADVVRKLRRQWDRGEFLSQCASGEAWTPLSVGLRRPSAQDTAARYDEVRAWVDQWRQELRLRVETTTVGGRVAGVNELPARAWIDSYDQLWTVLGVRTDVRKFLDLLNATKISVPLVAEWMCIKPMEVLRHAGEWDSLVRTVLWIDAHAHSDMYLRQVDVPGVDTKFIERNRTILSTMLDRQLPGERIDRTRPPSDFTGRYLLRAKPGYVRFRRLGTNTGFSELGVRISELADTPLDVRTVFVVENEVTYLAFPPVDDAVVLFGEGYAATRLEPLRWLADKELVYWGDIDTHGFAILNRLRRTFGHARSMLMDRATLLAHEGQWVREPSPVADHLEMLAPDEAALYNDLVEDVFGPGVRLEQERVSYSAIERAVKK
ncbi:hypothetical protein JOF56_000964 [Kibdelosporangium banguiense]|uniref:DUF3322 and DUF2220 domain-containing protein n=1 Tax=Kibdelosporangium banguiense TaxID=1365924 RepID=A0ABS4T829_9PSEU|nr:DUF3322 domain-containing protein [Kibdelosporangium banguiense]MBP2320579.1 hypothetical protein [Kibdelosporangium banguiense]